jgi:hypothetical protein
MNLVLLTLLVAFAGLLGAALTLEAVMAPVRVRAHQPRGAAPLGRRSPR